jgi:hypothetical protein
LNITNNYTGFFKESEKYALFPLDLKSIPLPNSFRIMFYAAVFYNNSKTLVDLTSWVDIPPAGFTLYTTPNPVVMRQGEQQNISVQVKSNTGGVFREANFFPSENSNIKIKFNPDKLNESSFGIAPAPFMINIPQNAQIVQYNIPILLNVSQG